MILVGGILGVVGIGFLFVLTGNKLTEQEIVIGLILGFIAGASLVLEGYLHSILEAIEKGK